MATAEKTYGEHIGLDRGYAGAGNFRLLHEYCPDLTRDAIRKRMEELEEMMGELDAPPANRVELEGFIFDMLEGDPWMGMIEKAGVEASDAAKNLSWDVARALGMPA
jgi:hypothetical protein